jgi:hypothetical protein
MCLLKAIIWSRCHIRSAATVDGACHNRATGNMAMAEQTDKIVREIAA